MPDLDQELLERVARWCAEAGRTTASAEIRRALGGLGWDELLAVRALLADPPPARPLGPFALVDLARGVPADVAADRERGGQYPALPGDEATAAAAADGVEAAPAAPRRGAKRAARSAGPVIRRARDAAPAAVAPAPAPPLLDELLLPEGRAVLERLVRRHGARRHALVAALAEGWRTPEGGPVSPADLARLLDHHGLARAFARREHDELLHALRAAGGLRAAAAARLGLSREELDAALAAAGAAVEAERIREARRAEVRSRATLAERVRLLLTDPARLEDLGVLAEVEDDLRRRLPEHLRAVSASGGPLLLALARSLSISPAEAQGLGARLGVPLDGSATTGGPGAPPPARARPRPHFGPAGATGGMRPPRRQAGGARPPRPGGAPRPARTGPRPGPPGARPAPRPGPPGAMRPGPRGGPRPSPQGTTRPPPRGGPPGPRSGARAGPPGPRAAPRPGPPGPRAAPRPGPPGPRAAPRPGPPGPRAAPRSGTTGPRPGPRSPRPGPPSGARPGAPGRPGTRPVPGKPPRGPRRGR